MDKRIVRTKEEKYAAKVREILARPVTSAINEVVFSYVPIRPDRDGFDEDYEREYQMECARYQKRVEERMAIMEASQRELAEYDTDDDYEDIMPAEIVEIKSANRAQRRRHLQKDRIQSLNGGVKEVEDTHAQALSDINDELVQHKGLRRDVACLLPVIFPPGGFRSDEVYSVVKAVHRSFFFGEFRTHKIVDAQEIGGSSGKFETFAHRHGWDVSDLRPYSVEDLEEGFILHLNGIWGDFVYVPIEGFEAIKEMFRCRKESFHDFWGASVLVMASKDPHLLESFKGLISRRKFRFVDRWGDIFCVAGMYSLEQTPQAWVNVDWVASVSGKQLFFTSADISREELGPFFKGSLVLLDPYLKLMDSESHSSERVVRTAVTMFAMIWGVRPFFEGSWMSALISYIDRKKGPFSLYLSLSDRVHVSVCDPQIRRCHVECGQSGFCHKGIPLKGLDQGYCLEDGVWV